MDKYLIVDFYNYLHRGLIGPGQKDKFYLAYLFFNNLRATVEQFQPTKLFFALEGRPKHRYEIYPQYKENRIIKTGEVKSESKIIQKQSISEAANLIKDVLSNINCTLVQHPDYEADDVINTLCHMLDGEEVIVITSDTDYIQLLEQNFVNCRVYSPIKKIFFEKSKYPYVAEKSIRGDKSDNIPCLLTPKKTDKYLADPQLLQSFLAVEENRAAFSINKSLIEFINIQDEMILSIGSSNFDKVKEQFKLMEMDSFTDKNEKAEAKFSKFASTFKNLII